MKRLVPVLALLLVAGSSLLAQNAGGGTPAQDPADGGFVLPNRIRGNPGKFTFAILGDRTGSDRDSWRVFDRSIEEINLARPDFVIMLGDMIEGHLYPEEVAAQWEEFQSHTDRLEAPFMVIPGNRDVGTAAGADYWSRNLGRNYRSFVHQNVLFLLLNTEEVQDSAGNRFGTEQLQYAIDVLSRQTSVRHTFVCMHQPAWALPSSGNEWKRIEEALGDRPYTVFAGHTHRFVVEHLNGRRHFSLGPTGGYLDANPIDGESSFQHYTLITVDKNAAGVDSAFVSVRRPGAVWQN